MINWMQTHKKKLIPAIWISTIAFVGAGFVGWGAYSTGSSASGAVAVVGKTKVLVNDLQQKYNGIYNYLSSITDGGMTQEKADAMRLEEIALAEIIKETLQLNLAKDLDIGATNEDVAKYLVSMPEFQVAGIFDRDIYESSLKRAGIRQKDFEESLKKSIILDKLNYSLNLPINNLDLEALASAYFMQDRISAEVIEVSPDDINVTQSEVKEYWEANKANFMTPTIYDIEALYVVSDETPDQDELKEYWQNNKNSYLNSDDTIKTFEDAISDVTKDYKLSISEENALKKYIALKKGDIKADKKFSIAEGNFSFPLDELRSVRTGEFAKPFVYDDGYLVARISEVNKPRQMTFDEAESAATEVFKVVKADQELEKKANEALANFNGKDLGFVTRDSQISYEGLSQGEFSMFLNELFNRPSTKPDFIKLENKAVVYNITEQRLADDAKIKEYKDTLSQSAFAVKNTELTNNLLEVLQKRYPVRNLYQGDTNE